VWPQCGPRSQACWWSARSWWSADWEVMTACLQSQIGRHRHLWTQRTVQVVASPGLSVVVRSGPVETAVNGTLVARPVRTICHSLASVVSFNPILGKVCPR
jgi:hypothetical protein